MQLNGSAKSSGGSGSVSGPPGSSSGMQLGAVTYVADNQMTIDLTNASMVGAVISGVTTGVSVTETPTPPIMVPPSGSTSITVDSAEDLRGLPFTVLIEAPLDDVGGTFPNS